MLSAQLKKLEEDLEAGRLVAPAVVGAAAAAGMATPPPAAAAAAAAAQPPGSDEGMMDRMRRFMQQIPGTSPLREVATPVGEQDRREDQTRLSWRQQAAHRLLNKPAHSCCCCCRHQVLCAPGCWLGIPAWPPRPPSPRAGQRLEGPSTEPLSEMDRRQRELYAKQQQLLREQRTADQEKLLGAISDNLGFHQGRPVAAVTIFRCCLQWKTFQADRTPLFDKIISTMGSQVGAVGVVGGGLGGRGPVGAQGWLADCQASWTQHAVPVVACSQGDLAWCWHALPDPLQVELHQENNAHLAYWLSNTVTLLYLMQKNVKPASGGGYTARLRAQGAQVGRAQAHKPGCCIF